MHDKGLDMEKKILNSEIDLILLSTVVLVLRVRKRKNQENDLSKYV